MQVSEQASATPATPQKAVRTSIMDGNQAAATIAYKASEVCAIYPITPSSAMGEHCDEWSANGVKNILGEVPTVVEMQSEAGAAGALHGALQGGALASTFTSSQGLLLMIPNMYKIAGELMPTVFHIAARAVATHALSIFGDQSDVMAVRQTGFAMLFGCSAQEAMDMALIAHAATLHCRVPFLNIFDGFRTSHELTKVNVVEDDLIRTMIDSESVDAFRTRALNPEHPFIRGTAQNPDVYFQSREAVNQYYQRVPGVVTNMMVQFAELTGRQYQPYEYHGAWDADRVIVVMGSAAGAVMETVDKLNSLGEKVGVVNVRLYRPFSIQDFMGCFPTTVKKIAVLDRTKEPGSIGEPLYLDVVAAFKERWYKEMPVIIGGRYGLASKEFTPGMVKGIFDELATGAPKNHFTIGITDDVTFTSIPVDPYFSLESQHIFRGLFYGLGSDGTVSANKNSIKIIGETTDYFVQGYFVYDSKKSGSLTTSHLRFGKNPIRSTYLIDSANFIACHHFHFIEQYDILKHAEEGATFLLNAPYSKDEVWDHLPAKIQQEIIGKKLKFYVVNASKVAMETGMGSRVNTILQTCFFAISNILPREEAIEKIKTYIKKAYGSKGESVLQKNYVAVDKAVENLFEIDYSAYAIGSRELIHPVPDDSPDFVRQVLGKIIAGDGDELPVSAFPADGTYPSGTTKYEKRNIADIVPVWDADLCSQCGKCFMVCPHAAIRCKVYDNSLLEGAPETFKHVAPIGKEFFKEQESYTLQVAVEDCTGCKLCVEVCPVESRQEKGHKAINMSPQLPLKETERANWDFFLGIPDIDRTRVNHNTVKGTQLLEPLFEFSGACAGCGETPYLKLLTQLFGDRMLVANATGCSSIYGGNLPTTPWTTNEDGLGPAWANSLFEDNAEFGLGIKLAASKKKEFATSMMLAMRDQIGGELVDAILRPYDQSETYMLELRKNVQQLKRRLDEIGTLPAKQLRFIAEDLVDKSVWIVGGDGWAYDIGFGGLDHVLSTGEKVNILVLDTEVYSNTGGQKSKASPLGASAKFSIKGKSTDKKDLAWQAIAYGNVYVAQIAMGANDVHTVRVLQEAEAFPGPSLIIAYSHCIAHGYDMAHGVSQQVNAVKSGYWPLFRYNPMKAKGERFVIDSKEPNIPLADFLYQENRFNVVKNSDPERGAEFLIMAEQEIGHNWEKIMALKGL
ncbi:MAG: pyruvate:ferredoxin (flavodoxin) oxidoreductase [Bacteroidetes bacterium]|nr:pyruvate:ferredoxin (flavodoxin) oxidoreductase [Bacteroidota bacterium]